MLQDDVPKGYFSAGGGGATGIKICAEGSTASTDCQWLVVVGGGGGADVAKNKAGKSAKPAKKMPGAGIEDEVSTGSGRGGVDPIADTTTAGQTFVNSEFEEYSVTLVSEAGERTRV